MCRICWSEVLGWPKSLFRLFLHAASQLAQWVKNPSAVQKTWVWPLGQEDPLEGMATHSSILVWSIHGQRGPAGVKKSRHDWSNCTCTHPRQPELTFWSTQYFLEMFSSLSLLFPTWPLALFRTTVCLSVDCCLCSGACGGTETTGLKFRRWETIARTHDATMRLGSQRGAELRQLLLLQGPGLGQGLALDSSHHRGGPRGQLVIPHFSHEETESQRRDTDLSNVSVPARVLTPKTVYSLKSVSQCWVEYYSTVKTAYSRYMQ